MSDYMHKEYKLPNGRTVTADFNELGEARVTIEAMDYFMDMINSLVEVVRCKDCKYFDALNNDDHGWCKLISDLPIGVSVRYHDDFCSFGERADT